MAPINVRFIQHNLPYMAGENATFEPEDAERLVKQGVAIITDRDAPDAPPVTRGGKKRSAEAAEQSGAAS